MSTVDPEVPSFESLYAELRRMARRELYKGGQAAQISPTTLLHEAYLQMSGRPDLQFADRAHFMAYAARAMRGIAIDHARARGAQKRGGGLDITALDTFVSDNAMSPVDAAAEDLEHIGQAVERLATIDPRLAELVDLKFFAGLTFAEIAALRGGSERTAQRDWEKARALLLGLMQGR
ncbi:MAG: ECF-type sigma factor [Rubrivivax sp.]|nr:ECF-type sigma factor [Rubrivivax sp.]